MPIYMDCHDLPDDAHHQLSGTVLDVDPTVPLSALLGERPTQPAEAPYEAPAMRAIVFTDLCGSVEQTFRFGDYEHLELVRVHDKVVRELLGLHNGREAKHTGDGIMASFTSVASAVTFAITAQRAFRDHNDGNPVPLEREDRDQRRGADHGPQRRPVRCFRATCSASLRFCACG